MLSLTHTQPEQYISLALSPAGVDMDADPFNHSFVDADEADDEDEDELTMTLTGTAQPPLSHFEVLPTVYPTALSLPDHNAHASSPSSRDKNPKYLDGTTAFVVAAPKWR